MNKSVRLSGTLTKVKLKNCFFKKISRSFEQRGSNDRLTPTKGCGQNKNQILDWEKVFQKFEHFFTPNEICISKVFIT